MREPYHQSHIHLIWATWDRLPVLTKERQERVYACIQAECNALNQETHHRYNTPDPDAELE